LPVSSLKAGEILREMGRTFEERNAVYGDNFRMVGRVMEVLFPEGVTLRTASDYDVWHLFELKVVKLTRFAISGLTHTDSVHDDAVYSAMIEAMLSEASKQGWSLQLGKPKESKDE